MAQKANNLVWFITGASTGFGRLLAEEVLRRGGKVIATARSLEKVSDLEEKYPERAKAYSLDVTDPAQVSSIVAQATACFAPVDVLVNNAGFGLTGAVEEVTEDEFRPMFETNVLGLIRVTKAFLPKMRERGSGHIVNLSSIGGLIGSAGWGYYNATKFAVEGFSEALAGEMAPLGISVTVIEPGPFRTDFLGRSGQEAEADDRGLRGDGRKDAGVFSHAGRQAEGRSTAGGGSDHRGGRGTRATEASAAGKAGADALSEAA